MRLFSVCFSLRLNARIECSCFFSLVSLVQIMQIEYSMHQRNVKHRTERCGFAES